MKNNNVFLSVLFCFIITGLVFIMGFDRNEFDKFPTELYQVYLDGKILGTINDKKEFYNLINKEQKSIKNKYLVDKIYPPKGLELEKIKTYDKPTSTPKEIYEKIKDMESFTIEGFEVIINGDKNNEKFFILKEQDLIDAVDNTIKSFVDADDLKLYRENKQLEITDNGKMIENIYLKENIIVKKMLISSDKQIFTNSNDLSRYMLFGTMEDQETYTVMVGDTIADIAERNNLNTSEFLIANPKIVSEYALLFPGQKVNIGLIQPKINIVVNTIVTSIQDIPFDTEVEYDNKMAVGTFYVKQKGINGKSKATFRIETINGADITAERIKAEELKPTVNEIVVKGGLSTNYVGESEYWGWPTDKPYVITSPYGWRWGRMHNGIDIAGLWLNAPIYSIQSGIVIACGTNSTMGNYVYVDHQNGYVSVYMHLNYIDKNIKEGVPVEKGQKLGGMGDTGYSFGVHLHLSIWKGGYPYSANAYHINPLLIYK